MTGPVVGPAPTAEVVSGSCKTKDRGSPPRREGPSVGTLGGHHTKTLTTEEEQLCNTQQYVGIDLHRRRSVIVRMNADGEKLSCVRLPTTRWSGQEIAKAGEAPEVVLEATYG